MITVELDTCGNVVHTDLARNLRWRVPVPLNNRYVRQEKHRIGDLAQVQGRRRWLLGHPRPLPALMGVN